MEILRRYEAEYPDRFRAVHSPVNRKQGGAKNIGLSMAGGEWIGFIDSDDWITPDMYEVSWPARRKPARIWWAVTTV